VVTTAAKEHLGYIGRTPGSEARDSDSWNTPARYLDAARGVLGGIDLDPYSSVAANERVGARIFFTAQRPAPAGPKWPEVSSCWMNPPYSGALVLEACQQFVAAFHSGRFQAGIVLVNNATETRFFQLLLGTATAVCFTNHRIGFENIDGKRVSGNTRGQAFLYFGPDATRFARVFADFGTVLRCGGGE
jgi:ParB family chromosome partitioning protein